MSFQRHAPVVLFAYNRLDHLTQTVEALKRNTGAEDTPLIVFCDGPRTEEDGKKVAAVRRFLDGLTGFASVGTHYAEQNRGLAPSVISGVSRVLQDHPSVIVLEDDIVTSPHFLDYMNTALAAYAERENVASISGYMDAVAGLPDTFFSRKGSSWGWATWRRVWQRATWDGEALLQQLENPDRRAELDFGSGAGFSRMLQDQVAGKNSSWAIRFYVWCFLNEMVHLTPGRSLVQNIGHDGSGTHCDRSDLYMTDLAQTLPLIDPSLNAVEDPVAYAAISNHLRSQHGDFGDPRRRRGLIRRLMAKFEGKRA